MRWWFPDEPSSPGLAIDSSDELFALARLRFLRWADPKDEFGNGAVMRLHGTRLDLRRRSPLFREGDSFEGQRTRAGMSLGVLVIRDLVRGPREVGTDPGWERRFWAADRGALSVDRFVMIEASSRHVLDLSRGILTELDVDVVLERVLQAARELTGARYAALGVLDA